jgi:protein tyrosine/serine phosphatase
MAKSSTGRILEFDHVLNVRDFGGLPSVGGGYVTTGKLFRGAQLSQMSDGDRAQFSDNNISLVLDIRHKPERQRQKTVWAQSYTPMTFVFEDMSPEEKHEKLAPHEAFIVHDLDHPDQAHDYMMRSYTERPHDPGFIKITSDALMHMANTGDHIYAHCAAGKDRTGTFAAIVLLSLGVHVDDVMAEYMRTQTAIDIEPIIQSVLGNMQDRFGRAFDGDVLRPLFSVSPEYLECSLRKMGNVEHYLQRDLGIDDQKIALLRQHYMA